MSTGSWPLQSALHAAGPQASTIEWLWWVLFWLCTVVFVAVVAALTMAVLRGRSTGPTRPAEQSLERGVIAATGVTVLVLIGVLFASAFTGRAIASRSSEGAVVIEVVGHQWWWEVTYTNPQPSLRIDTANELHIPTGRPVALLLKSPDVIHSLWIPNLHGKMDLVPGRLTSLLLQADRPGIYRGQCAEFCGLQHARMALTVVAEPEADFGRWIDGQRQTPAPPSTPEQQRGRELVEYGACMMCHTVGGTTARARMGPDLTHVATRSTIAAGTLPNTPDNLAQWIADPQHVKPGNRMPQTGLSGEDLKAVVAYLETLR